MADADRTRRSHRPSPSPKAAASNAAHTVKPRTAAETQKASLDKLFKDPSKEVYIPSGPKIKTLAAPRDMIPNVQGSSAGAGSGEFHVYKQSRRREYERLRLMEEEDAKDKATKEFNARQEALKQADDERTAKNREKRLKKKEKKRKGSKGKGPASSAGPAAANGKAKVGKDGEAESSDDSDADSSDEERANKKLKLRSGAPGVVFRGADEREQDDDQPREEEIRVKQIAEAIENPAPAAAAESQGLRIVDED